MCLERILSLDRLTLTGLTIDGAEASQSMSCTKGYKYHVGWIIDQYIQNFLSL